MSVNPIKTYVEREIGQIDHLLQNYNHLIKSALSSEPDLVELTAIGAVLQSFYNGIENIFTIITKRIDQKSLAGYEWHRELLNLMTQDTNYRKKVISRDTANLLEPYLGFRHVLRHSYSYKLDWSKMKNLVQKITPVWKQFVEDVRKWLHESDAR